MSDHLYHHGIKGMKWGVRRFQNPDGSLTEAGKRRQYKHDAKLFKKEYASARKSGALTKDTTRRTEALNKVIKEAQGTDEYKKLTEYDRNLMRMTKQLAEANGIRPDQIVFNSNDPVIRRHAELQKAASARGKQIAEKHLDTVAKATIDDIKLTDTTAARDEIKRLLAKDGYYKLFD